LGKKWYLSESLGIVFSQLSQIKGVLKGIGPGEISEIEFR
jgi:predicted transcriptional regulator with HTH domain